MKTVRRSVGTFRAIIIFNTSTMRSDGTPQNTRMIFFTYDVFHWNTSNKLPNVSSTFKKAQRKESKGSSQGLFD